MADFSAPSFSLGLDLDLFTDDERDGGDGGPRGDPGEERSSLPGPSSCSGHQLSGEGEEDETDFVLETLEEGHPLPRPLKRLRRGPPPPFAEPCTPAASVQRIPPVDDGIEVLSSQEDCVIRDECSSRQDHSACSSSKFLRHERRVPTTPYARKFKAAKSGLPSNGSVPISLESNNSKKVLPWLTTSPLRRIQLVDSDSDDLSDHGARHKNVIDVDACHKEDRFASIHSAVKSQQKTNFSSDRLQSEDLWKDSAPKKHISVATPAFDEFCEEYFKSVKSSNMDQWIKEQATIPSSSVCASYVVDRAESHHEESCTSDSLEHNWNLPDPLPPSYQYFYHTDVRIQKLVRQRLPNFVPLGDAKCTQKQQSTAPTIDYMGQFDQGNASFQVCGVLGEGLEGSSKSKPGNQKNTKNKKVTNASGPWVNPRSSSSLPKDVGKRVVHAAGRSTGHWYTGQDGRKVYVTRNGQELSGRIAYRHYRKSTFLGRKGKGQKRPSSLSFLILIHIHPLKSIYSDLLPKGEWCRTSKVKKEGNCKKETKKR